MLAYTNLDFYFTFLLNLNFFHIVSSFECNITEKDKQVQGVQHCWNVQYEPNKSQYQCEIKGLLPELTYRVYVVANYVMVKGNKPCEAQTSSTVLYYTIQGPPKCPTLWISEVGLYSVSIFFVVTICFKFFCALVYQRRIH